MSIQRLLLVAFLFIFCFSASAQSADERELTLPKAVFKISPLHFFASTFQVGTEVFNSKKSRSFNIDIGIRSNSQAYDNVRGLSTEIGFRKYVKPMTLHKRKSRQFYQGIYYNFFVQASYFKGDNKYYEYNPTTGGSYNTTYTITAKTVGPGFYIGLQKTLWEVLLLDVFVGGGIKISNVSRTGVSNSYYYDDDLFAPGYAGIHPKIGAKIGIGL